MEAFVAEITKEEFSEDIVVISWRFNMEDGFSCLYTLRGEPRSWALSTEQFGLHMESDFGIRLIDGRDLSPISTFFQTFSPEYCKKIIDNLEYHRYWLKELKELCPEY